MYSAREKRQLVEQAEKERARKSHTYMFILLCSCSSANQSRCSSPPVSRTNRTRP
jgi:hypothetical protein